MWLDLIRMTRSWQNLVRMCQDLIRMARSWQNLVVRMCQDLVRMGQDLSESGQGGPRTIPCWDDPESCQNGSESCQDGPGCGCARIFSEWVTIVFG